MTQIQQADYTATIKHNGAGLNAALVITITGTAVTPTITITGMGSPAPDLSTNRYAFADLAIDAEATTLTYTIAGTNLLSEDLSIILGTSAPSGVFTITQPTNPNAITPTNGAISQEIIITFNPQGVEAYTATLTHQGAGLVAPLVLNISGNGLAATGPFAILKAVSPAQITPITGGGERLNFGALAIDAPARSVSYTITAGNLVGNLTIALAGDGFTITEPTDLTLTPVTGAISQQVTIEFEPEAVQPYTATITHSGGNLTENIVLNLAGAGVAAGKTPTLTLQAGTPLANITELNFGRLSTSATPTTQIYTLTGANLTNPITLSLAGTGIAAFEITSPNNTTLTPGDDGSLSQEVTITFNPSLAQSYTAKLTHQGDDIIEQTIELSGDGIIPAITLQAGFPLAPITTLDFENLDINATPSMLTYTITGTDLNTDDLTVTLGGTNANLFTITASAGTVSSNILTITPANGAIAATTVTIAFDPTIIGDFSANLTHEGAGLQRPLTLNITGNGVGSPAIKLQAGTPLATYNYIRL